jgi:hypothetical protein
MPVELCRAFKPAFIECLVSSGTQIKQALRRLPIDAFGTARARVSIISGIR